VQTTRSRRRAATAPASRRLHQRRYNQVIASLSSQWSRGHGRHGLEICARGVAPHDGHARGCAACARVRACARIWAVGALGTAAARGARRRRHARDPHMFLSGRGGRVDACARRGAAARRARQWPVASSCASDDSRAGIVRPSALRCSATARIRASVSAWQDRCPCARARGRGDVACSCSHAGAEAGACEEWGSLYVHVSVLTARMAAFPCSCPTATTERAAGRVLASSRLFPSDGWLSARPTRPPDTTTPSHS
jgi:hypothetical protein